MSKYINYEQSGVDIDANDVMVERIWPSITSTYGPRVMDIKGGFAGLFRLDYDERLFKKNYKNPVLVSCTDGVGSKLHIGVVVDSVSEVLNIKGADIEDTPSFGTTLNTEYILGMAKTCFTQCLH